MSHARKALSTGTRAALGPAVTSRFAPPARCFLVTILFTFLFTACGGSQSARTEPAHPSESPGSTSADAGGAGRVAADVALPARPGRLWRRDVVAALSRGLPDFLGRLQVEPALVGGKFHGWRVVGFRAGDPMWQGTDLAAGDVITAVNDRPIERPEQAFAAFQSLAVAKELRVSYERNNVRRELVYPIDD